MRPALDADGIWCSSAAGFGGPGLIAGSAERLNGRRAAGTSMQRGLGRSAAGARPAGIGWSYGGLAVLLAGLGLSACVNTGQIVNLTEGRPGTTVAFESIDGAPPAVFQKLVDSLKEHAGTHQLSIVPAAQASYRLHGYLATHGEDGSRSIAWVWDVYDGDQRRVFRVSGEEKADKGGSFWDAADDAILHRIARTGMQQLAILSARPAVASASPRAETSATALLSSKRRLDARGFRHFPHFAARFGAAATGNSGRCQPAIAARRDPDSRRTAGAVGRDVRPDVCLRTR